MIQQNQIDGLVGPGQRRSLLSTAVAMRQEKRIALGIALVAFAAFLAIVPFARVPLVRMPAFIPTYEGALFFIDLITAVLLFDQFIRVRTSGLLCLASGYLFDAFIVVAHALSFPGAFAPNGLLGAREQTTAWLYVFWHGGFPLFVLGYVALSRRQDVGQTSAAWHHVGWAIAASVFGVAALTVALTLIATWGHDWLPVVMHGSDYSAMVRTGVSPAVWLVTFLAMVLLWKREQRVIDLWLMLVMWIWLFDIALAAVVGSSRFDLGFYAGRIFGLIASSFLLATLIVETIQLFSNAMKAAVGTEQQLKQLLAQAREQPEIRSMKKIPGEPVEDFVRRQNIASYRSLLRSGSLDDAQRHTIETLLSEEEANSRASEDGGSSPQS